MASPLRVAYFAIKYPTLSQTFIQREIEALCRLGVEIEVHPLWDWRKPQPDDSGRTGKPKIKRLSRLELALGLLRLPLEALRAGRDFWPALRLLLRRRPRTFEAWFMTVWGTIFALIRRPYFQRHAPAVFHGAWATGPATAAAVLARLCDRPFSFGAHAYDVYRHGGDPLLTDKLTHASFVHTTTEENIRYLSGRVPSARIVLSRRGLPSLPADPGTRTFHHPLRLLSVGRLVPKKAHLHQVAACAELKARGIDFHLKIAGEGPLREEIAGAISAAGLGGQIELLGAQMPVQIQALYAWTDLFWHTGVVDPEGDRDGLPNVIPEAMSHCIPVLSCPAPGATEAVLNEETGLVVQTGDPHLLADAVERLKNDRALARRLGENARKWVAENFLIESNAAILKGQFKQAAGSE